MKEPAPECDQLKTEHHGAAGRLEVQPSAWIHARVRSMPRLLTQAPRWVREAFGHDWAPVEALSAQAHLLPAQLWDYMLSCAGGFAVICLGESYYLPGPTVVRGQSLRNIAFVSVEDLAQGNDRPLHVVGHLIDHYLGSGGDPDGPWLSDGGGATPAWQQAARRLAGLFRLDYGVDEVARSGTRDYFAQSLAIYCRDRQCLSVADPQICRWLRGTLFEERFWQ